MYSFSQSANEIVCQRDNFSTRCKWNGENQNVRWWFNKRKTWRGMRRVSIEEYETNARHRIVQLIKNQELNVIHLLWKLTRKSADLRPGQSQFHAFSISSEALTQRSLFSPAASLYFYIYVACPFPGQCQFRFFSSSRSDGRSLARSLDLWPPRLSAFRSKWNKHIAINFCC